MQNNNVLLYLPYSPTFSSSSFNLKGKFFSFISSYIFRCYVCFDFITLSIFVAQFNFVFRNTQTCFSLAPLHGVEISILIILSGTKSLWVLMWLCRKRMFFHMFNIHFNRLIVSLIVLISLFCISLIKTFLIIIWHFFRLPACVQLPVVLQRKDRQ